MNANSRPIEERLARNSVLDPESGCVLWTGGTGASGYGTIGSGGRTGRTRSAHRVAYELVNGPIPDGLVIDHLCRNRRCINPDHLEPVTNATNCRRGQKAKLDWDAVREIRGSSESARVLAQRFGVGKDAICRVRNGQRWVEEQAA